MKKIILSLIICMIAFSSFAQKRPNIIFLLSDDQTSIATGCYGNEQVVTPNMDNLYKKYDVVFDRNATVEDKNPYFIEDRIELRKRKKIKKEGKNKKN